MNSGRLVVTVPIVILVLGLMCQTINLLQSNLSFVSLEAEVNFWGRGKYQPTNITRQQTDQGLARLVTRAMDHPDYLALRAHQLAWQSYWAREQAPRQDYAHKASQAQFQALQNRPAHRQDWAKLVQYAAGHEAVADLVALARNRQQALQPAGLSQSDRL